MKKWKLTYRVGGSTSFPIDMLRYDSSFPASELDSSTIIRSNDAFTPVVVELCKYCNSRSSQADFPTGGRWSSFGWDLDINSYKWDKLR